jgi:hypothetical protein
MMGSPTLFGLPFSVGGVYVKSEAVATANITGDATITAGGTFSMNADVVNSISEKLSIASKKLVGLPKKTKARVEHTGTGKDKVTKTTQKEAQANKTFLDRFTFMFAMGWGEAVSTSESIVGDGATITASNVDVGSSNDNNYDVSVSAAPLAPLLPKPGRIKSGTGADAATKPTEYDFKVEKDAAITVVVTPGAQDPAPRMSLKDQWNNLNKTPKPKQTGQNKPMRLKVELIGPDGNLVKNSAGTPIMSVSPPHPVNTGLGSSTTTHAPKLALQLDKAATAGTYTVRVGQGRNGGNIHCPCFQH